MRILSFTLLIACLGLNTTLFAQIDPSALTASPKTFIFSDQKHTVPSYIYATLKEETKCCGNDAIYLEVKFGTDGITHSAKTLTGKNECYKKSVVDIIKRVRWDATGVNGSKTIYFEVKPIIPCTGVPQENQYVALSTGDGASVSTTPDDESPIETIEVGEEDDFISDPIEEVEEVVVDIDEPIEEITDELDLGEEIDDEMVDDVPDEVEETIAKVEEAVSDKEEVLEVEEFLSDGGSDDVSYNSGSSKPFNSNDKVPTKISSSTPTVKYEGPVKIPPQADMKYVSKGERSPDPSHNTTFFNGPGFRFENPKYQEGEAQMALHIRRELRKGKYCGLAQAAFELTVDPSGNVTDVRVLAVNNEKVKDMIPGIVNTIKFRPSNLPAGTRSVHQFKTVLVCDGSTKKINLDKVPDIINPVGYP